MNRSKLKLMGLGFGAGLGALALTVAPAFAAAPKIYTGDTAWMLTSSALVLMMTIPGLALFYGGMVRQKNILSTLMQSFAITCLVTIIWWAIGYSLAFTPGPTPYLGGFSRVFFDGIYYLKDIAAVDATKDAPAVAAVV